MKVGIKGLGKLSSLWLKNQSKVDELKKIANKNNYKHKVDKLKERLTEDYKFWLSKGTSPKLDDIQRDVKFLASLQHKLEYTSVEKARIDQLVVKYPIS